MSLAFPTALLLGLIALPILLLYVLKVRLRRIPVSTNLFWKQMFDEKPPRAWWRKLRHLVSLLAQLLILALLVFAVADPFFSWQSNNARRIVLVMDSSASMQAADVKPSRFEAAKQAALKVLDGVRESDSVAIVSASNRPEVVLGMGGHVPTLKAAINDMQPSDGVASLDQAIGLAKQLIGDHPNGQVIVMTDGCADRVDKSLKVEQLDSLPDKNAVASSPNSDTKDDSTKEDNAKDDKNSQIADKVESNAESNVEATKEAKLDSTAKTEDAKPAAKIDVQYVQFASQASNVGITQFQARRSLVDALGYQILVSVLNASDNEIQCRLDLELDSVPVDVLPLTLKPGEVWTRTLEKTSLEGGTLTASLGKIRLASESEESQSISEKSKSSQANSRQGKSNDSANGDAVATAVNQLVVDDRAWAIVPPRKIQNVLVVSPGNLFLQKVFEANQLVKLTVVKELPTQWPADTIIVCHKLVPEKLPPGHLLIIDPESSCDLWTSGASLENPIITQQDDKSPLMTHLRLDNVLMPDARQLTFAPDAKIIKLANTVTGDTVFAAQSNEQSKRLILSVNLEKSDLAFRTAFPILVSNSLSWFSGGSGQLEMAIAAGGNAKLTESSATEATAIDTSSKTTAETTKTTGDKKLATETQQRWLVSPQKTVQQLGGGITGPLQKVGVWSVATGIAPSGSMAPVEDLLSRGTVLQSIAVNLANAGETDLRPIADPSQATAELQASLFTRPLWFYLAALVCILSVVEWCLYQRRIIT